MMSRHLILGLFTVAMLAAAGCRTVPSCNHCELGDVTGAPSCGCNDCGSTCGDTCGGPGTCGKSCGPNYDVCLPRIPFAEMRQRLRNGLTCGAGCSDEVYWGEWISDPPKCDPCDCFGNYIGPQGGQCRPGLLGLRTGNDSCCSMCDSGTPCNSCAHQAKMHSTGFDLSLPQEGSIIYEPAGAMPAEQMIPTPASPSDQIMYQMNGRSQPSYPTSNAAGRHPAKLGRGTL
ncbi:hypothetical protein [Blastopirellula marina]|uniref:TNFR-Cys domain-containing protein n=1 Tax=Blastopirellula marina TaxID=124 RepID=A0A2S8GCY0_9BACT|nr:hypothetical protein [Blastopirellula marina]PQO42289.1 hypothetical protein C5Y93_28525 [Blastopirellula marina]